MMSNTVFATPAPRQQELSPPVATTTNSAVYTDDTGFTVALPPGWTYMDLNNTGQEAREVAASQQKETLIEFCPERQSTADNITTMAKCKAKICL